MTRHLFKTRLVFEARLLLTQHAQTAWLVFKVRLGLIQGAYKFGKLKFPEFSRPLKQSFLYNYNVKTRCNEPPYQPFRYLSCSNAELQNIF